MDFQREDHMLKCHKLDEIEAVAKALEEYARAAGPGREEDFRKVFYKDAVMNSLFADGSKILGPIQNLYDRRNRIGAFDGDCAFQVDVLDIAGDIALGRVVMRDYGGMDFVDFHELHKESGKWLIYAKVSTQTSGDHLPSLIDYNDVKQTLVNYAEAAIPGTEALFRAAFHEGAAMNGWFLDGLSILGPIQNLYDRRNKLGAFDGKCLYRVDVLGLARDIAAARVVMQDYAGKDFVDFHELIKDNGKWQIIAKIFVEC